MKRAILIFGLLIFTATLVYGATTDSTTARDMKPGARAAHHGPPPPEAYTACEGKQDGDRSQFTDPRGETLSGVCRPEGDRMVLRPDRPGEDSAKGHQGPPPPEAYQACEGKSAGDAAQLVDPRGKTLQGTCEELDGKLVLRPQRPEAGN